MSEREPKEEPLSPGEKKIKEYVSRIEAGESKEKIMEGLPPSFTVGIEKGLESDVVRRERKAIDELEIEKIRRDLGIGTNEQVKEKQEQSVSSLVKHVTEGRKQAVVELYQRYLGQIGDPKSREKLITALCQDVYNTYRKADYPVDVDAEKTWEYAISKTGVQVDNKKKEWMYRGMLPQKGQETLTRGSMNVHVTPELIDVLDDMIASGKIKANYKFGQPDTQAAATERHDSISIYFLEEPSEEVLKEIGDVIKPHVRGDTLLGKKIADGFFMSEIGSIETDHIDSFIEEASLKDVAFGQAIKKWTSPTPDKKDQSLKMSEAQFYAIKDVAKAFGYDVSYDKGNGFKIES